MSLQQIFLAIALKLLNVMQKLFGWSAETEKSQKRFLYPGMLKSNIWHNCVIS